MRHDLFVSVIIPLEDDRDILPGFVSEIDDVMREEFQQLRADFRR